MEKKKQTMLEDIVPPLELCRLIPHPHFWNSAMCWRTFNKGRKDEYTIVFPTGTLDPWDDDIPAPTVQEIMAELPDDNGCTAWFCQHNCGEWSMGNCERDLHVKNGTEDSNPAIAALKLWLKLKGIEK